MIKISEKLSILIAQVYENSLAGTEVGNLTVSDEDKKDLHSCSIATTGVPFKVAQCSKDVGTIKLCRYCPLETN